MVFFSVFLLLWIWPRILAVSPSLISFPYFVLTRTPSTCRLTLCHFWVKWTPFSQVDPETFYTLPSVFLSFGMTSLVRNLQCSSSNLKVTSVHFCLLKVYFVINPYGIISVRPIYPRFSWTSVNLWSPFEVHSSLPLSGPLIRSCIVAINNDQSIRSKYFMLS